MASTLLSDSKIRGLKPKEFAYYTWHASATRGTGRLGIKVYRSGRKVFVYKYHAEGQRKFLTLGDFPTLSLASALVKSQEAAAKTATPQGISRDYATVKQLFDDYIADQKRTGKRSYTKTNNRLKQVLNSPQIEGDMPANEVNSTHIKLILAEAIQRNAIAGSNKIRSVLHAVFNFGLHADNDPAKAQSKTIYGLDRNPVSIVPRQAGVDKALDRFLSWDEINELIFECQKPPTESVMHTDFAQLILLCIFTGGQRPWELMTNVRENIDLNNATLTVPSHISKNGDCHVIPLCHTARSVLKEMEQRYGNKGFIFPAKTKEGHLLTSEFSKQINKFCKLTGFSKFTPRDIRRTFKTLAGEMGVSSELRDRLQNHKKSGVSTKHYDRYDYLKEKRQVVELWEKKLIPFLD